MSLEQDAAHAAQKRGPDVQLEPTILYQQASAGLAEVVDAFVRFSRPWDAGHAVLEIAGQRYTADFPAGEFGEERLSFAVRQWDGTVSGRVQLSSELKRAIEVSLTGGRAD